MSKELALPKDAWLWGTNLVNYDDVNYAPIISPSWFRRTVRRVHVTQVISRVSWAVIGGGIVGAIATNIIDPVGADVIRSILGLSIVSGSVSVASFGIWRGSMKRHIKRALKAEAKHVEILLQKAAGERIILPKRRVEEIVNLYFYRNAHQISSMKANAIGMSTHKQFTYTVEKDSFEDATPAYAVEVDGIVRKQIRKNKELVHSFDALRSGLLPKETATLLGYVQSRAEAAESMELSVEQQHVVERVKMDAEQAVRFYVEMLNMSSGMLTPEVATQRREALELLQTTLMDLVEHLDAVYTTKQRDLLEAARTHSAYVASNKSAAGDYEVKTTIE